MILVQNKVNSNSCLVQDIGKNRKEDIYAVRVEVYARIEQKRLLMTKELQSIWRIRENGKYKI